MAWQDFGGTKKARAQASEVVTTDVSTATAGAGVFASDCAHHGLLVVRNHVSAADLFTRPVVKVHTAISFASIWCSSGVQSRFTDVLSCCDSPTVVSDTLLTKEMCVNRSARATSTGRVDFWYRLSDRSNAFCCNRYGIPASRCMSPFAGIAGWNSKLLLI